MLCPCSGTRKSKILALYQQGVTDLESISLRTGACSGCGGCEADMLAFLAECAEAAAEAPISGAGRA
ncbi:hypothetical protein MoryE10_15210 [Methylogaea oryzae]|uniref:BFD-like [2Fe-2S]-binding domain-containing protein n=2 Tax=Methylogaea oryzae TaxID=1295382 RepID=A0A8D4VR75_9GAMM|nr:(2Fe-2S)-binding protein [Methylogaea oryzae]BBL70915.1 hypothetical protein MoryE10_15210 [Methylogaea oryzae]